MFILKYILLHKQELALFKKDTFNPKKFLLRKVLGQEIPTSKNIYHRIVFVSRVLYTSKRDCNIEQFLLF
jgi:hypothetical protein